MKVKKDRFSFQKKKRELFGTKNFTPNRKDLELLQTVTQISLAIILNQAIELFV